MLGEWLTTTMAPTAAEHSVQIVPVSLADVGLPFLDEEEHPSTGIYRNEHTKRWSAIVDAADGFVVVTPEYNYGMPATFKNALDYLSKEWAWKPIGFVSYGNTSAGTRSVQHAKQVVTTLRLVPLGATLAIRIGEAVENGRLRPDAHRDQAAGRLLEELVRVSHALRPLREREQNATAPGPLPGSYLRRMDPCDAGQVAVLQRCCWVDEAITNDTLTIPALKESLEDVEAWLTTWHTWGLWQDARLVGMVRARRVDDAWHVGRLGVVPDLRGRGLGSWLVRVAEEAREPDCRSIVLFTGARSATNIRRYESAGYQRVAGTHEAGAVRLDKLAVGAPGR